MTADTSGTAAPCDRALVMFSGGQDSTVCLAWALDRFAEVETVGFDYGQRHAVELAARTKVITRIRSEFPAWAKKLGPDHIIALPELGRLSETALTRDAEIEMTAEGLPSTFVPGRNLLFATYAAALSYRRSIGNLVGGMCETDYSGYPDCRDATMRSLEETLSLGLGKHFELLTPLMFIDKAATWEMAMTLGGAALVDLIIEESHTCYMGVRETLHEWGYGCGTCPACELRARGYELWTARRHTLARFDRLTP